MDRRARIEEKIRQNIYVCPITGCHIWLGSTSGETGRGAGYPRMSLDGGTVAVHRTRWINNNGAIPPRKQIDHKCRNRLCVNDEHLEMVTQKTNCKRRDAARCSA